MDSVLVAILPSLPLSELRKLALDHGIHFKNAVRMTRKELERSLRELILREIGVAV
jgi:hypothetical protein